MLLAYSLLMALYSRVLWEQKEAYPIIFPSGMPVVHTCFIYSPQASYQELLFSLYLKFISYWIIQVSNLDFNNNYPVLWFLLVSPPPVPSFSPSRINPESSSQMQSLCSTIELHFHSKGCSYYFKVPGDYLALVIIICVVEHQVLIIFLYSKYSLCPPSHLISRSLTLNSGV